MTGVSETMKKIAVAAVALAGGLAVLAPLAGAAQPAPPPLSAEAGRAPGPHMRPTMTHEQRAERIAERLRTQLQLQPNQEGALRAYVSALTPKPGQRAERAKQRGEFARMTTPQRLDAQRARLAERTAAFERRAEATKRFYAELTPSQQKAFDALRPHAGPRKHGGPGMGRHRG